MKLTSTQLEAGGTWYEHGQQGKAVPGLVKAGLVEFRSGGVGNYVAPAIKPTLEGNRVADDYLAIHGQDVYDTMLKKIAYIQRNLQREGKL